MPSVSRILLAAIVASGSGLRGPAPAGQSPAAAAPRPAEPAIASYVSARLNGKPLPVADKATDSTGVQYLIEFEELILTIRPNHEFRAALRYRQTLATKGERLSQDPIRKMTVYGSWSAAGNALRFVPDPKRGGGGLTILAGTFSGARIEVPFDYRNGTVTRRARVLLVRDDKIF
ncbi:MAG TPA: hypothetical protein VJL28_04090 [Gemmatimonadaceae bacterium]|nr:hypothetical protein [Gemmatimonadaceae bacterium]